MLIFFLSIQNRTTHHGSSLPVMTMSKTKIIISSMYVSNRLRRSSPLIARFAGRPTPSVTRSGGRVPSHRVPSTLTPCGPSTTDLAGGQTSTRRPTKPRTAYKHVPHRDKPPHLVARRNARERRRVQAVNSAFLRLRRHLPHPVVGKHKRLSKVR